MMPPRLLIAFQQLDSVSTNCENGVGFHRLLYAIHHICLNSPPLPTHCTIHQVLQAFSTPLLPQPKLLHLQQAVYSAGTVLHYTFTPTYVPWPL